MSIRKKILAISIGPVLVLGVITLLFMLTMVKSSLMDEVQDALKGTAAATLAAYDQNTGDYLESTNGDIWKGSYNISKSESLVDRIKENTGMDVTFFYGNKRIMTSRCRLSVFVSLRAIFPKHAYSRHPKHRNVPSPARVVR